MSDIYTTIRSESQGLFKDKGSRFIAYAFPVRSEEEVKPLLDALRKEHHAARHCCYAYRISSIERTPSGPVLSKEGIWRASDDGEPSGTAGRQILGQIDSAGLQDVLVAVVRYFGGILLGVPGLIRAYRSAAADALSNAGRAEVQAVLRYTLRFPYEKQPEVEKMIKDYRLAVTKRDFSEDCSVEMEIPPSLEFKVVGHIEKMGIFINHNNT